LPDPRRYAQLLARTSLGKESIANARLAFALRKQGCRLELRVERLYKTIFTRQYSEPCLAPTRPPHHFVPSHFATLSYDFLLRSSFL